MLNTIFYFTGTGNSLKAARDIAAGLQNVEVLSIAANAERISGIRPEGAVGFVFPVYYCGLPQIVHEYISAINLDQASYIWIACTYGSTAGNGGCISQTAKILKSRGKVLNAAFYVKTVDNFILWTWDIPPIDRHPKLHENARRKSEYIAQIVASKKNHYDWSMVEQIGPVIFRHKHFHNTVNDHDTSFYSGKGCTSCGLCADVCPTHNIDISNNHPIWKSKTCQRCLACLHLCPAACIQYGKVTVKRHRYRNPYVTVNELRNR